MPCLKFADISKSIASFLVRYLYQTGMSAKKNMVTTGVATTMILAIGSIGPIQAKKSTGARKVTAQRKTRVSGAKQSTLVG